MNSFKIILCRALIRLLCIKPNKDKPNIHFTCALVCVCTLKTS